MDASHEVLTERINTKLADMFPEWQGDQREAIACILMHAALDMKHCDLCDYHSL